MMIAPARPSFVSLFVLGMAAGIFSGLFGVGGGTLIMPALVLWLGMQQRLAAGTSVAAILPTAVVGASSYAVQGNIDWIAALCLAIGMIIGAQVGAYLLARLSKRFLQWAFMIFLLVVIVNLWIIVPSREDSIGIHFLSVSLLIVTGLITGVLSGLLGVGGGVIIVPILMFFFGSNDLIAKGSSLAMMIPGSISATLGNFRRQNVDLRAASIIGITASFCVPFSSIIATLIDPFTSNVLFSLYLAFILVQMFIRQVRPHK